MTVVRRLAGAAGLTALATLTMLARGEADAARAWWPDEADLMYLPNPDVLRLASLGHSEMTSDLVAARTNVYFGTQIGHRGKQRWLDKYIDTVIRLDPWFHRMYLTGATLLVYNGREISVDSVLAANALLERGIKVFPYDWELYFQHGFNFWFELPNSAGRNDPRITGWKEKGAHALEIAAQFADAPAFLPSLVARLQQDQGMTELAIRSLEQAYAVTSSEESREQIRRKLIQMRGKRQVEELEEGLRDLQLQLAKCPRYMPEALCLLLGPPPHVPTKADKE